MIPEADIAAVLRKAAEGLRDPERVVLDPWHLFEDANGGEVGDDEAPCRACAVGHLVWASAGAVSPLELEMAVTDAVSGSVNDLTLCLRDEGAAVVADWYDRVADGLEAAEESS
jgi:hypothetical protein